MHGRTLRRPLHDRLEVQRHERGTITAVSAGGATLWPVNALSLEHYLYGVVPRESPPSWALSALQAQSVAARSYAVYKREHAVDSRYDICSTTSCQVYAGVSVEDSRTNLAVDTTANHIRTYGGTAAFTEFSSSNGGWTAKGGVPYQVIKADPWDWASANPNRTWTATVSAGSIEAAYPAVGTLHRIRILSRNGGGEWGGRVVSMALDGSAGTTTISGDSFRSALGLRSTYFTLPTSAILAHWSALGGPGSIVGNIVSSEYWVPGGAGQDFQFGKIYWSPASAAHEVHGGILERYSTFGGPAGPLRFPLTDEAPAAGGGAYNLFQGGAIFWRHLIGAFEVHGGIYQHWTHHNREWGPLGYPLTDERYSAGGAHNHFERGGIYWHPTIGARAVLGPIHAAYLAAGGPPAGLAYPTSDQGNAVGGGTYNFFQGGAIFWRADLGAHEVHGAIFKHWTTLNREWGPLGYPTTNEYPTPTGARSDFEHGSIHYNATTGATTVTTH